MGHFHELTEPRKGIGAGVSTTVSENAEVKFGTEGMGADKGYKVQATHPYSLTLSKSAFLRFCEGDLKINPFESEHFPALGSWEQSATTFG